MLRDPYSKKEVALRKILRERRKSMRLRQSDLAKRLEMPQSFVSKFESGERLLTFVEALVIFKSLNLDPKAVIKKITSFNEIQS